MVAGAARLTCCGLAVLEQRNTWSYCELACHACQLMNDLLQVFFGLFMAAMGAARSQLYYPDVALGKAATKVGLGDSMMRFAGAPACKMMRA